MKEQSAIKCRTYKKALKYGIDITAFGSESATIFEYGGRQIIFYDDSKLITHVKYSILHELGHPLNNHDFSVIDKEIYGRYEVETNYFAAQLLMPEQVLRELANREMVIKLRLNNGGHSQKGMELLDKYGIKYNIVKTYPNGVRVGNIPNHKERSKKTGIGQSWFPKSWTEKDIRRAGEHVAGLKGNRRIPDGKTVYGVYKGVHVGIKRTNGKIATVFPDSNQNKRR